TLQQSGGKAGFLLAVEEPGRLAEPARSAPQAELLEPGRALAERALAEQQVLVGADVPLCRLDSAELHYALAVPLRAQGQVNPILVLCDDSTALLRPGVQEAIMLLANHAGAALRNAVLYSELDVAYQRRQELDRKIGR